MRRTILYIFTSCLLCACNSNDEALKKVSLGDCHYSPSFLWTDEEHTYIEKTLVLDFSEEAQKEQSQAELEIVDAKGKALDLNEYEIFIDGKRLAESRFLINANQKKVAFMIGCSPNSAEGIRSGMLRLRPGHSLDRIENTCLASPQQAAEICGWEFTFEQNMNPLAKTLLWTSIVIASLLLLWLFILCPVIYPRFRNVTKMVIIPNQQPITLRMKGAREIVISNTKVKVNLWSRIFKGEIKSYVCPAVVSPIVFKPKNKKTILVKINPSFYQVRPSNIIPTIGGQTEIKNVQDNTIIKIK